MAEQIGLCAWVTQGELAAVDSPGTYFGYVVEMLKAKLPVQPIPDDWEICFDYEYNPKMLATKVTVRAVLPQGLAVVDVTVVGNKQSKFLVFPVPEHRPLLCDSRLSRILYELEGDI